MDIVPHGMSSTPSVAYLYGIRGKLRFHLGVERSVEAIPLRSGAKIRGVI